jgi:hypothetical protein
MKSLTLTAALVTLLLAGSAQAYIKGTEGLEAATLPPPGFYTLRGL